MSGGHTEEAVHTAVPVADLAILDAALAAGDDALRSAVLKVRPADVGRDLSRRTLEQGRRLLEAADDRRGAAMLRSAHPAAAARMLVGCKSEHTARLLGFLPMEVESSIVALLDADDRARVEAALPADQRSELARILAYPEAAVARLMSFKIWRASEGVTVAEALALLRDAKDEIEVAQNCYFTDAAGKLVGVAPLRELAVVPPDTRVADVMTRDVIAVGETTPRADAAEIVQTHNFLSLPVVDAEGKLVGAVRVDDLLDDALSAAGAGLLNQGAVARDAAQVPYFLTPLWKVVRSRITWLVLLFVAETATGTVLRHFEDELAKVVALSFFIPLLIGTGGNAGSQTVSTVIRALAVGEVRLRDAPRVLLKEVTTGLLLGILLGFIAFGRALLWGVHVDLALCVAVTVLVVCTWANTVGSVIPLAAERLGIDPTVISGPLITTLVDASGLFIYLTIAKVMIAQLH